MAAETQHPVVLQAKALLQAKRAPEAASLLQQYTQAVPTDRDACELHAIASFSVKDYPAARDAFQKLTRMDPKYAGGWVNLGAVQNLLEEHKEATTSLRKAIQKDKKSASAYYNLGIAQRALNMKSMAVSAYREAIRIKPTMPEPYANLANLYIEMNNLRLAIKTAEEGAENCPNFTKIHRILQKARDLKEGNRKEESPLGRLVDEKELASRQIRTAPRDLDPQQRVEERTMMKDRSKMIRECCKPIVEFLDKSVPHQLHVISMAAAQKDVLGEATAAILQLQKLTAEIERLRAQSRQSIQVMRTHFEQTDAGL